MPSLFMIGGARSGKSRHAQMRAEASGLAPVYLATAQAFDGEMVARIARHQAERDGRWRTVDAPLDLPQAIVCEAAPGRVLLVDCLTLWLSNLMLAERNIAVALADLERAVAGAAGLVILVSNEVGQGIVPDNALARRFRDEAGWANQRMAACCDEAVLVCAGLALRLK